MGSRDQSEGQYSAENAFEEGKRMFGAYTEIIVAFLGGIGFFLFGMNTMAHGLQKSAGAKMKKLLEILTKNKLMAVLVGTLVTGVIQSSTATTVMVVGFVNAGIMNLTQSVGVIMGANIGTTVTSWLVSSIEWAGALNPITLAPVFVFIGTFMVMFSGKDKIKNVGEILVGFGTLFIGMSLMTEAASPLKESQMIMDSFVVLGHNPLLAIFAGAFVTAVVQSSSASVSILQTLALAGLIPWNAAIYIIMGQNIGTCITAMISSIGTSKNAKAAAYVHLLFNTIGSVIFSIVAIVYFTYFNPAMGISGISITQIGIVHTSFNIACTIMLYPFSGVLVHLAQKISGFSSKPEESEDSLIHLDDRILDTPSFAIDSCLKEIDRLGQMSLENLKLSSEALIDGDISKIERVYKREASINTLQEAISGFMVKLCNKDITEKQNKMMTSLFHTVIDIERIGDHSENIADLAQYKINDDLKFSEKAMGELTEIIGLTCQCVEESLNALKDMDMNLVIKVIEKETTIDSMETELRVAHIKRLTNGECHGASGVVFLDTISNLERVSDHALNIAEVVMQSNLAE